MRSRVRETRWVSEKTRVGVKMIVVTTVYAMAAEGLGCDDGFGLVEGNEMTTFNAAVPLCISGHCFIVDSNSCNFNTKNIY